MRKSIKIRYDKNLGLIESVYKGNVTVSDLTSTSRKTIELSLRENCFKFLTDLTDCSLDISFGEVFALPDVYRQEPKYRELTRIAVIKPKAIEDQEFAIFYKEACEEKGWDTEIFENKENAIGWLNSTS